jgi:predicted MFS family arabinose efflux permease
VLAYTGLLISLVSSLGAPLVPTIGADYGVSLSTAQWSLTVTLLVGAIAAPVIGRLGDGPQRLRVLLTALGILVAGGVLAALPGTTFALLIVGRAMQGVGLALLPLLMGIARDHLPPERSRGALATLSVTAVVGLGLGYPFTGLVAEHLGFHAGFWVAAGLGLLAMALAVLVVPTSMHRPSSSFDLPGAMLLGLGLGALLISISEGEEWGWFSSKIIVLAVMAVLILAGWVGHELRTHDPLVDLRQLRNRTVLTADATGVLAGVGMYMLMSMIIRYVQTPTSVSYGLGASVVVGGLTLLPMSATSFTASRLMPSLTRVVSPTRILPFGALLFAASLAMFGLYRDHLWQIFVEMGIAGLGIGFSFAVMPRMIVSSVPGDQTSSALALNQVLRTIGYSLGSALSATILAAHTAAPSVLPANHGFTVGALVAIALCVLAAVVSWVLPARAKVSGPGASLDSDQELLVEESVDGAISGVIAFEPEFVEPASPTDSLTGLTGKAR